MKRIDEWPRQEDTEEQEFLDRLALYPQDTATLARLQAYYHERARFEDEMPILGQLLEADLSPSERAETLHDLAYALYRQDKLEEAIAGAESLIQAYPDYHYLSSVLWLLGVMHADRMNRPGHLEMWHTDWAAAESYLKRALDYVDDDQERVGILVELGGTLMSDAGKLEEAKLALEQALAIGIKDPQVLTACHQRLGRIYYRLHQVEQARQHYEQSVLAGPEQPSNFRALAYVYLAGLDREQGEYELAEQRCHQARYAMDESSHRGASNILESIYEEQGDIALAKGEYQQAVDHYQAAFERAEISDEQQSLYRKIGDALIGLGQPKRALESFRQALAIEMASGSINEGYVGLLLFRMGRCLYDLHEYEQAAMLLEKAARNVQPYLLAEVHQCLAHSYFSLRRYQRAAELYQQVIDETERKSPEAQEARKYLLAAKRLGRSRP